MNVGQEGNRDTTPVTTPVTTPITNTTNKEQKISELSEKQKLIISFCSKPKSAKEILEYVGVSYQTKNLQKYITYLVDNGFIARTIPDQPFDMHQKYVRVKRSKK